MIIRFLIAFLILTLLGDRLLEWICPRKKWGIQRMAIAFGIGQGVTMWLLWVMGWMGVPMWTWGIPSVTLISIASLVERFISFPWREKALWIQQRYDQRGTHIRWNRAVISAMPYFLFAFGLFFVWQMLTEQGLKYRISGVPGLGNWAYKAKLIALHEVWPVEYFQYESQNRHMAYPPGYPLLIVWFSKWMGGFNDHLIRLLPIALAILSLLTAGIEMIRQQKWWSLPGLLGLVIYFLAAPMRGVHSHYYAEPLLIYMSVITVILFMQQPSGWRGYLLFACAAACMAWVKQEGAMMYVWLGFFLLFIEGFKNHSLLAKTSVYIGVGILMLGSWQIYLMLHDFKDGSFAWGGLLRSDAWDRFKWAASVYAKAMWVKGESYGGAWWLLPGLWMLQIGKMLPQKVTIVMWASITYVISIIVLMVTSQEVDFAWHLASYKRVLLCPSVMLMMCLAYLKKPLLKS